MSDDLDLVLHAVTERAAHTNGDGRERCAFCGAPAPVDVGAVGSDDPGAHVRRLPTRAPHAPGCPVPAAQRLLDGRGRSGVGTRDISEVLRLLGLGDRPA